MKYKIEKIGNLIDEISVKNQNLAYKNLIGLNIQKEVIQKRIENLRRNR